MIEFIIFSISVIVAVTTVRPNISWMSIVKLLFSIYLMMIALAYDQTGMIKMTLAYISCVVMLVK